MPSVVATPVQTPTLIGASRPQTQPRTLEEKKSSMAASLSRTDAYITSGSQQVEQVVLSLFNSYQDSQNAMVRLNSGARVVTDYTNVVESVKRAAVQRTVTSSGRNAWDLYRGKVTLAEAGGRVVGDVTNSAVANGAGAVATNLTVFGLSKVGLSSLPVMVGGMVAGFAANNIAHRVMNKTGAREAITDKTSALLSSISN